MAKKKYELLVKVLTRFRSFTRAKVSLVLMLSNNYGRKFQIQFYIGYLYSIKNILPAQIAELIFQANLNKNE